MTRPALFLSLALTTFSCVGAAPEGDGSDQLDDSVVVAPDTANTAVDFDDPPARVRVRAAVLSVDVDPHAVYATRDGRPAYVLRGRTSRNVDEAASFVFDDGFADTRLVGPRSFEIVVRPGHELNTLLSGLRLFVHLRVPGGTPEQYTASVVFAPRLESPGPVGAVRFDAAVTPVYFVDGVTDIRYRAVVRTTRNADAVTFTAADDGDPALVSRSARKAVFDWDYDHLALALDATAPLLRAGAVFATGAPASATARVEMAVQALGLTTRSAEVTWPTAPCRPAVEACVRRAGSSPDLGACGTYREVDVCRYPSE